MFYLTDNIGTKIFFFMKSLDNEVYTMVLQQEMLQMHFDNWTILLQVDVHFLLSGFILLHYSGMPDRGCVTLLKNKII